MNFGLAFGSPILEAAQKNGAPTLWSPNAVFLPLMLAGGAQSGVLHLPHEKKQDREPLPRGR
jgi:hypothetical protein